MSYLNFKDFLTSGALLQTSSDRFKVLLGPFKLVDLSSVQASMGARFLYRSNFWDFLNLDSNFGQNFVYSAEHEFEFDRVDFIGLLQSEPAVKPNLIWENVQETGFKEQFDWSMAKFKSGELKKTVPIICQRSNFKLSFENKIWILQNLLENKNSGWSYASFENEISFIGHTPESLLVWNGLTEQAQTMALAGTLPKSMDAVRLILADKKILQEHDYVVEDIKEKLKSLNANFGRTRVLELKHLVHLKTDFNFYCKNLSEYLNAVAKLHPTAAMGIYPDSRKALQEFSNLSLQKERGPFASVFGLLGAQEAQLNVSIRNLIFTQTEVRIYSGCGITIESQYANELAELENKRNSVKKMLGLNHD